MPRWRPFPIVGGAYSDDTRPWSVQDTVNYLPVSAERGGTRSPSMFKSAPGFTAFCDLGTGLPVRGAHNAEGSFLVVSGNSLFSVSPKGVATNLGIIPGVGRVSMAHNQITGGNQIAIANGLGGYVYDTTKGALTQITDDGFTGAICFDYIDSYMAGVEPGKRFWFTSDLADATSYNTLDRYEAEGSPDKIVSLIVTHREVWVMGERTIEPFQNTGAAEGTFQRAAGMVMERGLASTFAVALLDNSVFWLGDDGCVYRANGYQPVRISTFPIEQAIARCNLSQAFAFTFEDQGHKVFYLTFPDGHTWGYDVASGEWHRRQSYGYQRWRLNTLTNWNGGWYGGDFTNGKIYKLDWNVQDEDGATLEKRRISGVAHDNQNRVIFNGLELVIDTGREQKIIAPPKYTFTSNLYPQQLTERTAWAMTPGDVTIHTEIKRYTQPTEKSSWSMTPGTLTLHSITQYYTQPPEKTAWSMTPGTATITTIVKRYTQPAEKSAWSLTPGTLTIKKIVIRYTNPSEKTAWALSPGTVTITTP